jgi:phage-related protein
LKSARPLRCHFFATTAGNEPVREWLKGLPKNERLLIGTDLLTVQYAWPIGKPLVAPLGFGLWEVRTHLPDRIARVIFFVHAEVIVLLHGFIKKSRKTPPDDLDLAKKRTAEFLKAHNS